MNIAVKESSIQPSSQLVADPRETPWEPKSLLGSRFLDFWLVGGASIVVWALLTILAPYKDVNWAINRHIGNLPAFTSLASLFINYPHFMVSYRLSYGQGWDFTRKHWWQMLVVPGLLVFAMTASWMFLRNDNLNFLPLAQYSWAHGREFGRTILAFIVNFMFFTVGWHYSKQMFGIMMVYAKFDGYKLTQMHRNLIKASLFSIWFVNYSSFSGMGATHDYSGISYSNMLMPDWILPAAKIFCFVSFLGFFGGVIIGKFRVDKQLPSATFMVPMVSLILWWLPNALQNDFYMYLVPFFHSLQYLCFVKKSEEVAWTERGVFTAPQAHRNSHYISFFLGLVVVGWLSFECIPAILDNAGSGLSVSGLGFFFIAAGLFINIHHYFIDNVLWRFQTSKVAQRLVA